ncbi:MAG: TonB-dependent receptor, partial [Verrucomicrobia bacterium]|nr:TonB-dependent receptor [Verrucomicrobiota bacterium]
MHFSFRLVLCLLIATALAAHVPRSPGADTTVILDPISVTADPDEHAPREGHFPVSSSITGLRAKETINVVDAEDALKYLPSIFLRKRNYGDTQAVMATRAWGVSSSARSLAYVDGLPLSALIANNNNIGAPRWGLVAPEEIERIDVMHGPFSAAYPGNSMGAVVEISTRQPRKKEASLTQTEAWQHFRQYGTGGDYLTHQSSLIVGAREGALSFWVSGNYQDSHSQPLAYVTSAVFPAGTSGGFRAFNKLGVPANIVGSSGLLHTRMSNAKFKVAYALAEWVRATYTFGIWRNDAGSRAESYLLNAAQQPTFAGLAGFAAGTNGLAQQHSLHGLSVQTDTKGPWDFQLTASRYHFDRDRQNSPTISSGTDATATSFGSPGRVAVLEGTGWTTLDASGAWRPNDSEHSHVLTFGIHDDQYRLFNPTYNTSDWPGGRPDGSVATEGDGKTRTQAAWLQDAWQLSRSLKLTAGLRYEEWKAWDGFNASASTIVRQRSAGASNWSLKVRLAWKAAPNWTVTASAGKAYRYATAAELYQLVSTGTTFASPNPNLKPDNVLAAELSAEHLSDEGRVRVSLFQDEIHDAIISQFLPLVPGSPTLYSYLANVDHVRARGAEVFFERRNVLLHGLDLAGSVTYLDARTLAISGQASAGGPPGSAIGKRVPNVPEWRATFLISCRLNERWNLSLGGRYSGMLYTTLDNADVNPNTYQGFA